MSEPATSRRNWILVPLGVAIGVRVAWALADVPDYWGDAYHNWLVERLTLENGFVYSDYKGRELVWLPLFRYLAAAAMGLTGLDGLLPGRLVSLVAGTLAVGFTAAAARRWTGRDEWGVFAGLLLALNPWHVAYSWMNMPEAVGTFWVALAFYGVSIAVSSTGSPVAGSVTRRSHLALMLAGTFGALTRNDVTSILALTGAVLLLIRRRRPALILFAGLATGLVVWSTWTGVMTGEPLWWLKRRAAGSTDDAGFWIARGSRPDAAVLHLFGAWAQAATAALVATCAGLVLLRRREIRTAFRGLKPGVPATVAGIYIVIVGVMFDRFFSWPDPRYLMMPIVPLTLATTLLTASSPGVGGARLRRGLIAVSAASLLIQLPTFPVRAWAHERDRIAGAAIMELESSGAIPPGPIWIDAPVAIHTAGIALDRIRSSDQITGWGGEDSDARERAVAGVRQAGVRTVYWDEVPYSRVHRLWPEMANGLPFERDGLRFEPLFRSDTVTRPPEADWIRRMRERVQAKYSPVLVWRVEF